MIDAGLLLDHLSGRLESMKDYDAIKDVVNTMPTAYDVDKVVEQIKSLSPANYVSKDDVLKIVKGGGVDAKTDS